MTHAAIIGNGITGITAARRLRALQPDWDISVISGESTYHYSRPALMYIFMGHMRYKDTKPFEDHTWERERINLVRDWVTDIDTGQSALTLHKGGAMLFDHLLLATGSKPNKFGWPGQDLNRVSGLYDLMDLRALYDAMPVVRRAVIVGGGLIGLELAEMLHSRNVHVTFLVREQSYWSGVLPPDESAMVTQVIRDAGFDLRLGVELDEIIGDDDGGACAVVTKDGERIECQYVGLTAGVSPNLDLVRETDIETGRGILVDWSMRTNIKNVYAAGDCTRHPQPILGGTLRLESVHNAMSQGKIAASNLLGIETEYAEVPWFWSDQYATKLQMIGLSNADDEAIVRGDMKTDQFSVLYLREGRLMAADVVNNPREFMACRKLVPLLGKFDRAQLADAERPLQELL